MSSGPVALPAGEPPEDVDLLAFPAVGHRCVHVVAPQVDLEVVGVRRLVIVVAGPYRHPEPGVGDAFVVAVVLLLRVAGEGAEELYVGSVHESSPSSVWVFRCPVARGSWGFGPSGGGPAPGALNRGRGRSRPRLFRRPAVLSRLALLHGASPSVWYWWRACRPPVGPHGLIALRPWNAEAGKTAGPTA